MLIFSTLISLIGCQKNPMPELRIPENTWVLRESFQGPGPERTGNWWGRFDQNGCWWEAHNTWLVVTDEVLMKAPAHPLHWNAVEPEEPWFCLNSTQIHDLKVVISTLEPVAEDDPYRRAVDRWTIIRSDGIHSLVKRRSHREGGWESLTDFFELLSSVRVWGQSPE